MDKKQKKKTKDKVLLPLGAKFSFFVALLLVGIMVIITLFIYNWAGSALEKEVKERGIAIAKNIANNAADPLLKNDDLPLAYFTKEAVQSPMKEESSKNSFITSMISALKNDITGAAESQPVKNEGI